MWDSVKFWEVANKLGVVLTILGFALTVFTLYYAGSVSRMLKRKVRVPEVHGELSVTINKMRMSIKLWGDLEMLGKQSAELEGHKQDVVTSMHQARAYVQSIRPSLESLQRKSADEIISHTYFKKERIWRKRKDFTINSAWDAHNRLQEFSVHLDSLVKDRAAVGI